MALRKPDGNPPRTPTCQRLIRACCLNVMGLTVMGMLRIRRLLAITGALSIFAAACGGGSKAGSPFTPVTTSSTASPVSTALQRTPAGTPAPADAAVNAAVAFFGGVLVADGPTCQKQTKPCVLHGIDPDSPDRGVTVMELGDPQGGGAMVVFGRQADGSWSFWFGTQQQVYHALVLPAEMRVCADGQGVNVRQSADEKSQSVGLLKDGTKVTAENFVLTQAGSYAKPGPSGNGWYSVSGPAAGYIRADFLSVTTLPDCQLRDFLTKS
jgi:hypothetical protein